MSSTAGRQGSSPEEGLDAPEQIAVVVLGAAAGLSGLLWATAKVAGWVTSGRWVDLGVAGTVGALVDLPGTLSDPAGAFPPPVAAALPGPWGFWAIAGLLVAVPVAAALWGLRWWAGRQDAQDPPAARWADRDDLGPLVVRRPQRGRLVLGRSGRRLLAGEAQTSMLVVGPEGSGKTAGLAIPALLEWDGPVVAASVKADLLEATGRWRAERGGCCWVYDPTDTAGHALRASWSPLAGAHTWRGALRVAESMAQSGRQRLDGADFWYSLGAKLLAPLLLAASSSGASMRQVVSWADRQDREEVAQLLKASGQQAAVEAWQATWRREPRIRSSVYSTVEQILRAFADPQIATEAGPTAEIDPDRLVDGGQHSLYIVSPLHEQRRLRPLFSTLVEQVLHAAYQRHAATGQPLDPPLLLVLDEAANIAPLPDLDRVAATARDVGVQLVTVWQDRAQITARYGDGAATVVNNHRAKLILPGIHDRATTADVAEIVGDTEVMRPTRRRGPGGTSTSQAPHMRPLIPPAAVRELDPWEAVLLYGRLPPARLQLRPWFHERNLRKTASQAR